MTFQIPWERKKKRKTISAIRWESCPTILLLFHLIINIKYNSGKNVNWDQEVCTLQTCVIILILLHLKDTKLEHIFSCVIKDKILEELSASQIVIKTNYSKSIRKHYTRIFVLNNHELDKEFNSLRNLIHGIIRYLLKLSYLCSGINATSQFIKHFAFKNSGRKKLFH